MQSLSLGSVWRSHVRDTVASYRDMRAPGVIGVDLGAGLAVACIALPLNLALAIACGLPASVGIITGAVAGLVAALIGSSRLQITGPEIALAPISFEIVQRHGVQGLIVATFLAGLLQIVLGLSGVARLVSTVPRPVVGGFLTAIGLLVLGTQLPRMLGLPAEVRSVVTLVRSPSFLKAIQPVAVGLAALVVATMLVLPRITKRIPAPLVALVIAAIGVYLFHPALPAIGELSVRLSMPNLKAIGDVDVVRLLPEAFALALLASLDSLLSAAAIDAISDERRHAPDHELVAQGIANMASAAIGGMPVAGAIVRSSAALQAGARTRLSAISQSFALLFLAVVGASVTRSIPIAALAAILFVVGLRLVDLRGLSKLARVSRFEAGVFIATVVGILLTDFVAGVLLGMFGALIHFAHTHRELTVTLRTLRGAAPSIQVASVEGAVFFASHTRLTRVLESEDTPEVLVLDLSHMTFLDSTGAAGLRDICVAARARGSRVLVVAHESNRSVLEHGGVFTDEEREGGFASLDEAVSFVIPPIGEGTHTQIARGRAVPA